MISLIRSKRDTTIFEYMGYILHSNTIMQQRTKCPPNCATPLARDLPLFTPSISLPPPPPPNSYNHQQGHTHNNTHNNPCNGTPTKTAATAWKSSITRLTRGDGVCACADVYIRWIRSVIQELLYNSQSQAFV